MIELPPAGTLVGLAKRAMPGVETVALKTPDDLEAARALVASTASTGGTRGSDSPRPAKRTRDLTIPHHAPTPKGTGIPSQRCAAVLAHARRRCATVRSASS